MCYEWLLFQKPFGHAEIMDPSPRVSSQDLWVSMEWIFLTFILLQTHAPRSVGGPFRAAGSVLWATAVKGAKFQKITHT